MSIDLTTQMAPVLWLLIALMLVFAGAILASVDPDRTETVLGDRRVLFGAATLGMLAMALMLFTAPLLLRWP